MSVIDYLLVPVSLFPIVRQLIVSNFTTFSDHAFLHIQLSLLCNKQNSTLYPDDETRENLSQDKFKWNDELKEQCRDCLLNNMEKINMCRERIDFDGQQLLDNSLAEFTSTLNVIMAPFFKKRSNNYKSDRSNICDDKPWFNAHCKDLHRRYIKCLNIFNRLKSQLNHSNLIRAKKDYKTLERRLKREYMRTEGNMLDIMRLTNPKLFYKKFKRKASPKHAVPLKLFHEHFKSLCSSDTDAVLDDSQFNNTDGECVYEELDREITENDILKAIRNLKRDKSHGVDGILNEYFIEYKDVFMPVLLYIFNGILQSGIFPTDWAKAILIPIFKKGNVLDPNNYRGISLVSNFGKLFTSVLNQRLIDWSETFDIVTDAQFGFRPGLGTVDAIFALTSLIFKSLSAKNRFYCCFVDYTKAFDTVQRYMLWYKLSKIGIQGKFLMVIKAMYSNVTSCVSVDGFNSDYFTNEVGLMQGEVLSPIFFSMYVNDCEMAFINSDSIPYEMKELNLFLLMYADDMVIFSETVSGLQTLLDTLYDYTSKWSLSVNIAKTKIVVFRKGGKIHDNEKWYYNNQEIEVVDKFSYLGILLNFNGKYNVLQQKLSEQVNCMCSWPCNWQKRTFYNEAANLDLFVPNAYQLNIAPDTVIECLIREGPFIVGRRVGNVYRCIKINDVCEDSFVVIQTPLIKLEHPPNLCDICTPGNLTSKPQVWVDLGCDVPKNCPVQRRTETQCNGCEKNQPNDDIACSTCKKDGKKKLEVQRKYSGEKKKSTYGSYSGEKKKSTYGSFSRSSYRG
ncbi:uncharacterized protein LOC134705786 [Mytilus trossulus]|uniref:uncharacterized protein LOC134705786 n=1 Tax=Mytilus trossulus TaxID=6551 RepID=UPI0030049717